MDISVVIPVYGSQTTLRPLTERLCAVLDQTGRSYEIIFVNDDSPDQASAELEALRSQYHERLVVIELTRNFGQHNAIMCGFHHARGRTVVTMDDDLQHPPEELPKLLAAIEETGLDVVYGRYDQKKHGLWRNLGSRVLNLVYRKVFGIAGQFTSFRVIRREIVQALLAYDLNFTFIDGLLAWNTRRIGSCTVEHAKRPHGRSGYSLRKLVVLAVNLLTNFSLLPLQVSTLLGLFSSCVGFLVGVYYLGIALLRRIAVPGYASTITAVLFLGGVQLLAIGIIGEYVGRLHLNVNRKPQFRVRRRMGGGDLQEGAQAGQGQPGH
jgi:undecaprenyl-phosphate 4-deoxy-4-formamido-L-arabinose transferase